MQDYALVLGRGPLDLEQLVVAGLDMVTAGRAAVAASRLRCAHGFAAAQLRSSALDVVETTTQALADKRDLTRLDVSNACGGILAVRCSALLIGCGHCMRKVLCRP